MVTLRIIFFSLTVVLLLSALYADRRLAAHLKNDSAESQVRVWRGITFLTIRTALFPAVATALMHGIY